MRTLLLALPALAALLLPAAASALHCDGQIIRPGQTRAQVRHLCGEPTDVSVRVEERTVLAGGPAGAVSRTVAVAIERWTLNFGPRRFMHRIEFRDGVVLKMETLGRGYPPEQLGAYGRNVHLGNTPGQVRAAWGEPTEEATRVEERSAHLAQHRGLITSRTVRIQVETWVYNFGPQRFMRRVVFEDGEVVRVETLDRGY